VTQLQFVLPWVLASVFVGVGVGYYLGRSSRKPVKRSGNTRKEREVTLKVLANLLTTADRLHNDVDVHNSEIKQVGRNLIDMPVDPNLRGVQHALLDQVASVLESNRKLEDDLTYARLKLEQQAQEIDRTRREARTDALSGVANRKAFDERLDLMLRTWRREGESFVLILTDIDHFKWINDTHGHHAGDCVVAHVGQFIKKRLREDDFVARYGGDEFAMLLPGADLPTAAAIAERIRSEIAKQNFDTIEAERVAITFSIGVAAVEEGDTAETILRHADEALYKSKQAGRNKVNCYQPGEPAPAAEAETVAVVESA
jgi:diguanylate cyclase